MVLLPEQTGSEILTLLKQVKDIYGYTTKI